MQTNLGDLTKDEAIIILARVVVMLEKTKEDPIGFHMWIKEMLEEELGI